MTSAIYDFTSNAAFNATFDADPDMPWQAGPSRHRRLDRREARPHAYSLGRRQRDPSPHPNGYVPQRYVPQGLDPAKPNQAFDNGAHPPKVVNAVSPAVQRGPGQPRLRPGLPAGQRLHRAQRCDLPFSTAVFRYPPDDLTLAVVGNESTNSTTPTSTFGYPFSRQFYPAQWS